MQEQGEHRCTAGWPGMHLDTPELTRQVQRAQPAPSRGAGGAHAGRGATPRALPPAHMGPAAASAPGQWLQGQPRAAPCFVALQTAQGGNGSELLPNTPGPSNLPAPGLQGCWPGVNWLLKQAPAVSSAALSTQQLVASESTAFC